MEQREYNIPSDDSASLDNVAQDGDGGDYMSTYEASSTGSEYEIYDNQYRFIFQSFLHFTRLF